VGKDASVARDALAQARDERFVVALALERAELSDPLGGNPAA
jgi:hypothetical protein